MSGLTAIGNTAVTVQSGLSAELYKRWVGYIDASPRTIETYGKAIRRFFAYLMENGITRPTRETIVAYRDSL